MQPSQRGVACELPMEVLQHLLQLSNGGRLRTVDPVDAVDRGRNQTLLRTSLVCKAWAAASQYLLTRDICVGSRTTQDQLDHARVETSAIDQLLEALARLPDCNHVRSAQLELGSGWTPESTFLTARSNRYNGGLSISGGRRRRLRWVQLQWANVELLPKLLEQCPNLQHLGMTIADPTSDDDASATQTLPDDFWDSKPPMLNIQTLSFVFKTEFSSYRVGSTVRLLAQILSVAPNLVYLHVDTYFGVDSSEHPDVEATPLAQLRYLRELRVSDRVPSFLLHRNLPALETLIWRNADVRQVHSIPPTVRRVSFSGDWAQIPFGLLPNLRHALINGSDVWDGSSFFKRQCRETGDHSKRRFVQATLAALPPGLESFTLVESFAMRVVARDALCAILLAWANSDAERLPRTFKLLHQPGALPDHYFNKWDSAPIHLHAEFEVVKNLLLQKGVQVVLVSRCRDISRLTSSADSRMQGETDDPFAELFQLPGVQ